MELKLFHTPTLTNSHAQTDTYTQEEEEYAKTRMSIQTSKGSCAQGHEHFLESSYRRKEKGKGREGNSWIADLSMGL